MSFRFYCKLINPIQKIPKRYSLLFGIYRIIMTFSFSPSYPSTLYHSPCKMLKENSGMLKPGFSSENTSCWYQGVSPLRCTNYVLPRCSLFANVFHRRSLSFLHFADSFLLLGFRQLLILRDFMSQLHLHDVILSRVRILTLVNANTRDPNVVY